MSAGATSFSPVAPLLAGRAEPTCRACVTLPARNEETALIPCLNALRDQVDLAGQPLEAECFEILLLLNNCTDGSAAAARHWQAANPTVRLHVVERTLQAGEAHVGVARRLLMDTAWARLGSCDFVTSAILSTDADSVVAPDWIVRNMRALASGADVVGGLIGIHRRELDGLPEPVQRCYLQDRRYATLVAELEHALDPQPGDPCPRHLDHFGSSLACTPKAYAAAGGMPPVSPLEDEAFIDQARRANLRIRHDPAVQVFTSGRLDGRALMGMAGQLRMWSELPDDQSHLVPSASFLEHRFRMLHQLRRIFQTRDIGNLALPTDWWRDTFAQALRDEATCPGFLGAIYCDIFIAEAFRGVAKEPIRCAILGLEARLRSAQAGRVRKRRKGTAPLPTNTSGTDLGAAYRQ